VRLGEEVFDYQNADLARGVRAIHTNIKDLNECNKRVTRAGENLDRITRCLSDKVDEAFDDLIEKLQKRRDEVKRSLQQEHLKKIAKLEAQNDCIQQTVSSAEAVRDLGDNILKIGEKHEILAHKGQLTNRMKEIAGDMPQLSLMNESTLEFDVDFLQLKMAIETACATRVPIETGESTSSLDFNVLKTCEPPVWDIPQASLKPHPRMQGLEFSTLETSSAVPDIPHSPSLSNALSMLKSSSRTPSSYERLVLAKVRKEEQRRGLSPMGAAYTDNYISQTNPDHLKPLSTNSYNYA